MPYSKHTWSTQEPITKDRMDNIEKGIADATSIAEANETKIGYTSNEITTGGNIKQRLNNLSNTVTTLNGQVDASFRSDLNAIKTQVNDARGDLTLAQTLQNIRDSIVPVKNNADTAMDAINKAHRNTGDTLKDRFEAIEDVNEIQWTAINNLRKDVTDAAQGQDSLDINLTNIKNRITQINTELKAGDDTTSLQVKLKNLSDRIVTEQGRITSTNTEVSNIKTTLGYEVSSNPSQATIKQIIENNASKAQLYSDGVESRAQRYTDTKISENNTTLNTRFNSIEGNISTIATELNMIDGTSIKDTNTRVDTIESTINNSTTGLAAVKTIADAAKTAATTANTNIGTGFSSTNTVRKELDTKADKTYVDTELSKKADKTEVETKAEKTYVDTELAKKAAASSLTSLSNTVNTLLDKDTIVISKPSSGSNYTNDIPNMSTSQIKTGADYLIQADDNKYYYWRYINNKWELISGKNEEGEFSSGTVVSKLPSLSEAKENTDYFVGDPINGYLHYRFITVGSEKQAILIGTNPENVKRYNVIKTETQDGEETLNYLDFYEFNYGEDSIINSDDLPSVDKRIAHILLPQGGSGSGSGTTATTRFVRIPPTSITTIQNNEPIYIRFFYSCVDSTGESHSATYTLKDKNGAILINSKEINSGSSTATIDGWPSNKADDAIYEDGYGSIDVSKYCSLGSNKFYLTITTELQESLTRSWTVDVLQLRLESNSSESALIQVGNTIDISYTPFGAMQKYLNVKIDNNSPIITALSSTINGSEQFVTIPAQSEGAHKIELWLSANINGKDESSNSIIRDYIWYQENSTRTILASPMRNLTAPLQVTQYSEISIPYTVYKPNTNTINVEYYYDYNTSGTNIPFDSVSLININNGILKYNMMEASTLSNKTYIPHNIAIKVDEQIIIVNIIVIPLAIDVSHVNGAVIDFDPSTLTNNSVNRLPSWTVGNSTYSLSVSDNFNWSTRWEGNDKDSGGGYREEEDGKCFVIRAGNYVRLNYKMFKQRYTQSGSTTTTSSTVFDNGASMKIIFKVGAVRDASAIWFTNMGKYVDSDEKEVGIQLSAHEGFLKTNQAVDSANNAAALPEEYQDKVWDNTKGYNVNDIVVYKSIIYQCIKAISAPAAGSTNEWNKKAWQSLGQLETEISATNSYLYFPYSEEDKIELDININKKGNEEDFIMSYEDGVPSKAYPYNAGTGGDILYQVMGKESDIIIGSEDCDVYIYRLRIYDKSLKTNEILKNFIADGNTIEERIKRYQRNAIYYDEQLITDNEEEKYTPYSSATAVLNPIKLAEKMKDVKILMLDCPRFTVGKKDFIKYSSLRCIQAVGGKVYPGTLEKDNWYFFNGYHAGQGTTSDNYGQSARNVDFLFECDGTHYPTKKDNLSDFTQGYRSGLLEGNEATVFNTGSNAWENSGNTSPEYCSDWKGEDCKISLTHFNMITKAIVDEDTSIPNNYFNLKTNVASSENVNNALFQKRYNDFLPYESPAKKRDSRIKNGMEFVPAVLFIRENSEDLNSHTEFKDREWHFYALGNLGDSKKTDYTRAYDPDDMNEFTVEISDNNTSNSQFQSGVYNNTVETSKVNIDPVEYTFPITSSQWNQTRNATAEELAAIKKAGGDIKLPEGKTYVNYRHHTLISEGFDGDHSFEFRYACKGDYRDGDLINDTSEVTDIPNPDTKTATEKPFLTKDDIQFNINRNVWFAFYEWVVTATKEEFKAEAVQWFVPSAIEFFYAFTHYYTMMDNRAKNTFWHFAKTGQYRRVSRPVKELAHIYEVASGNVTVNSDGTYVGTFVPATGTFNASNTYYTQYAFDLWVYDTDTACGIDNNGELSFPYGREDNDYRVPNQPGSSWAFNGAGSIFWRRLRSPSSDGGFSEEIAALMRQEDDNCFSESQHIINEFDQFQECFPEEIWRLDIERKYIRTFTGKEVDNSISANKKNVRFLRSMMQGRKKYQRRQWIRNQAIYFGSKYALNNVRTDRHTMEFVLYTPTNPVITPDWEHLVLVPYQDMYVGVAVGNSTTNFYEESLKRAKAGERVTVDCSSGGNPNETRVYIFGGEHISAIENLAPMYIGANNFELGKRLKVLSLGSDNPNYNNLNLTSLTIGKNMPLLETLNIKNCNRLAGQIDLSESNNLKVIEAEGSAITGITLPNYTGIETLHLPITVTTLGLNSARYLDDFYIKNKTTNQIDYSYLINLNINNSDYSENIDWLAIAGITIDNKINQLYLQNLYKASINDINELQKFVDKKTELEVNYDDNGELIKQIILSGIINVKGAWSTVEKQQYETIWPDLTLDVSSGTQQIKHMVTYKYDDYYDNEGKLVPGQTIKQLYINDGDPVIDIWQYTDSNNNIIHMLEEMPSRASTVKNNYSFGLREYNNYITLSGWKLEGAILPISSLDNVPLVKDNLIIETYFYVTPRTYYVNWYLKSGVNKASSLVKTSGNPIEYGGGYELEAPTIQEIHNKGLETAEVRFNGNTVTYSIFDGWEKLPTNITPSATDESYDIYGKWVSNTVTLANLFSDTTNLSPEQLLVLSAMSSTQKNTYTNNKISVGSKVTYTLGQDSIKEGISLIGPDANDSILRLDFQTVNPRPTAIAPLSKDNEAFTLMIDYCFNTDKVYPAGSIAAVLMSCYEQNNSADTVSGFALYYNLNSTLGTIGPRIGFGDMFRVPEQSVAIGNLSNANARNVIVLRHPKNSTILYVYFGLGVGTTSTDINITQLAWNNVTADAVINFGQLTNSTSEEYTDIKRTVVNGSGTIYQVKYWNEDLGIGECKRLAAWPHEDITYRFSYLSTNATEGTRFNTSAPSINLTSITNSSYGNISISTDSSSSTVGWGTSEIRTFYNNRIFKALPTRLQAILCRSSIAYKNAQLSTGAAGNNYNLDTIVSSIRDYIYAPSIINIQSNNDYINEDNIAEKRPYKWLSTNSDVEIYKYSTTTSNNWQELNGNAQYKNLRFPYIAIDWSQSNPLRVFDLTEASVSNFYNEINKIDGYIKVGDVCLAQDGYAYIYINTELITQNGAQAMLNEGLFATPNGNGGWVRAKSSCLRSISTSGGFRTRFGFITTMGIVDMSVTSSGSVSLGINYEFAI